MATEHTPEFSMDLTGDLPEVDTLVVGFTDFGLAGLTAVDYLTEQLSMVEIGHLSGGGPPFITPFENGVPRHHTRLFADGEQGLAVLVAERLVPARSSGEFAETIVDRCADLDIPSITVLTGVPVAHGPEDHVPFYVATDDYRAAYLSETGIRAMGTGFVDGATAEFLRYGMDTDLAVGVFTTPAHQQAPDAEAAVRLVRALTDTHDLTVSTEPLEAFAADVEEQYRELANRVQQATEESRPEDRMYM